MKLGILGGTFDPPHNGHLQIATMAQTALQLHQIIFIPAKQPPHKQDVYVSVLETRVAMLECALEGHPSFLISMLESEREGPSYTVDTLRQLRLDLGADAELFFIMGEDSLVNFPTWHQPGEIVKLCRLAVLQRPGYDVNLDALEEQVRGVKASTILIPAPEIPISASDIRERVGRGESIHALVPELVEQFIAEHRLYRD